MLPRQRRESRRMAARTVAGGRARSARPPAQICGMGIRPRLGSRIKYQAAWIPSATAAAVGKSERVLFPVVSRFARDHRLPSETPSGVVTAASPAWPASRPVPPRRLLIPRPSPCPITFVP